jgi:hypothetical protein
VGKLHEGERNKMVGTNPVFNRDDSLPSGRTQKNTRLFLPGVIVPEENAVPGAVIAIQTFGDFLGFNLHCQILCTDGGFYGKGMSRVAPCFIPGDLEKLFRFKVFKMLLSRKKITEDLIDMMMGWRHSGFNVYCGPRIQAGEEEAMENLARYNMWPNLA